jgi:hypothetical protein
VDAAVSGRDLGELDYFLDGGKGAGHVEEAGAHAEGAGFHPFLDQAAHLVELGGRRPPVRASKDRLAHRALADERADIDGLLQRVELVEKRAQRHDGSAVGAFDDGGDALPDVVVGRWNLEDVFAAVIVNIDEARRDDLAARIDHARRGR